MFRSKESRDAAYYSRKNVCQIEPKKGKTITCFVVCVFFRTLRFFFNFLFVCVLVLVYQPFMYYCCCCPGVSLLIGCYLEQLLDDVNVTHDGRLHQAGDLVLVLRVHVGTLQRRNKNTRQERVRKGG